MRNEEIKRQKIILFDGVCNLCNGSVIFILQHERRPGFVFASLQSEVGMERFILDPPLHSRLGGHFGFLGRLLLIWDSSFQSFSGIGFMIKLHSIDISGLGKEISA
jgi:hypothetical protein